VNSLPPDQLFIAFRDAYQTLGKLLEQHRHYLLKIIHEQIGPQLAAREGASDIVQTAFFNIIKNLQGATQGLFAVQDEQGLKNWLAKVAQNALRNEERNAGADRRDFHRDQPASTDLDQWPGGSSPSSICRGKERDELLGQAINALPEADRMLLRLSFWHNWTHLALAELLDGQESEPGRMRVQRRLKALIFDLGGDDSIQDLQD
jgi:RNA polymerase sigma factor (sigma-70 family)